MGLKRPLIRAPMACVKFFGNNGFAWKEDSEIKDYEQFKNILITSKPTKEMAQAIEEVEVYLKNRYIKRQSLTGAATAANKKFKESESKKREVNDSASSASGPSSTKMARVTKNQTKAVGF